MSFSPSYCSLSHLLVARHDQCASFLETTADLILMLMVMGDCLKTVSEMIGSFWEEATAELVSSLRGDSGD